MATLFTLAEATRLLPQLTELLAAIQAKRRALDGGQQALSQLVARAAANGHLLEQQLAEHRAAVERRLGEINALIDQVNGLGCEVKDVDMGLVDFPTVREGRSAYLCWRLGEPAIAYWHDVEAGYAGRQPL